MGRVLWTPPPDVLDRSRLGTYLRWLRAERGLDFAGYDALWRWSVDDLDGFWRTVWDYFEVVAEPPPAQALAEPIMPGARWFPGAELNYAEHVLRAPGLADDDPAVLAYGQTRPPTTVTVADLRGQVGGVAAGLRRLGVRAGDRVVAYAPNIPETLVLMLAAASLGAIFSSCAPEFGTRSVTDRWRQIEPVLLLGVDGYRYGERAVDRRAELAAIRAALPSVQHTVFLPYLDPAAEPPPGAVRWAELAAETDAAPRFEPVPFDHPLYVLYSSGTTGLPKPIVHGHGGILLEHLKVLALHLDLGPGDRFFWFTTTAWMMWNFVASGPAVGAAVVLFDGDPGHPDVGALWRLAEQAGITYFGTSAPYLQACRKDGIVPKEIAELSAMRAVGSTGAPLPAEGFTWVYETIAGPPAAAGPEAGTPLQLQSLSGGTDVCTAFIGAAPIVPVYEGELSCRCLGARVEAFDPAGTPVVGELGELVITAPMPSMPVGFWNDPDGRRYREAYFDTYPGVWRHGDWILVTDIGSCVISGRSDATLNRGGVRLGTAEFYAVVEDLDEVADSLVVHLEDPGGGAGRLLLFVVLTDDRRLDDTLRATIGGELRAALSPRHVPDEIHQVPDVPRTLNGKKLEVPVKRILTGVPVESAATTGALANPESLAAFARLAAPPAS